jgi:hypothetical protein
VLLRRFFLLLNIWILSRIKSIWYFNLLFFINCIRLKRPFYFLNLRDPKTFSEKINLLKNERIIDKSKLADKLLIKDLIKIKGLIFPRNLIVFNNAKDLRDFDFKSDLLVNGFVIKANHGSGMNLIFHKGELPSKNQINQMLKWFYFPSHMNSREEHYNCIDKKVFIEEIIIENVTDYKFHCFNNKPVFVQVDVDRFTSHKRNIYNLKWDLQSFDINYSKCLNELPRPIFFDKMIEFSIKINETLGLSYLRVDFYETTDKLYLGEVTFHPGGGVEPFDSYESDLYFGSLLIT